MKRREFVPAVVAFGAISIARVASGQQSQQNFTPMEQGAYRPTLRDAKPGATPQLTVDQRDQLEHKLKCQCGCILDIYTCRTTDFTCQVSPAMHRDVLRLVDGGYTADEILAAFVETYGEVALTEPKKEGFNWAGYFAPGAALAVGAIALTAMIVRWTRAAQVSRAAAVTSNGNAASTSSSRIPGLTAEDEARLDRALREDS